MRRHKNLASKRGNGPPSVCFLYLNCCNRAMSLGQRKRRVSLKLLAIYGQIM
jgi:hypothetical protein